MDTNAVLVDAVPVQLRSARKKDPKPWIIHGTKSSPNFEQYDGADVLHVGYELQQSTTDSTKLVLSDKKLYLKFDVTSPLMMFYTEQRAKLTCSYDVPGYAVFPCGFFLANKDVKQSNQQTLYKRAWQMTYAEWKKDVTPLTCEDGDEQAFWKKLYEFVNVYKGEGRERKSRKRKTDEAEDRSGGLVDTRDDTPSVQASPSATEKLAIQASVLTTYHYANSAQRQPGRSFKSRFETTGSMDIGQKESLSLQLKEMAKEVPPEANLECVIGIWKMPTRDREVSEMSPESSVPGS